MSANYLDIKGIELSFDRVARSAASTRVEIFRSGDYEDVKLRVTDEASGECLLLELTKEQACLIAEGLLSAV